MSLYQYQRPISFIISFPAYTSECESYVDVQLYTKSYKIQKRQGWYKSNFLPRYLHNLRNEQNFWKLLWQFSDLFKWKTFFVYTNARFSFITTIRVYMKLNCAKKDWFYRKQVFKKTILSSIKGQHR